MSSNQSSDFLPDWYWSLSQVIHTQNIWIYCSPVIIVIGTIGNGLSLLIMQKPSFRTKTTGLYLSVLASVDTTVLFTGLGRYWSIEAFGFDIRLTSDIACKLHVYILYLLTHFESWVIVCIAIERCVAVCKPLRAKALFTRLRAVISLFICGTSFAIFDITRFINNGLHTVDNGEKMCLTTATYYEKYIYPWIALILMSGVPFIIIIICNSAIIIQLSCSTKKNYIEGRRNVRGINMTSMTTMLMTTCFCFILLTLPIGIYQIVQNQWFKSLVQNEDFVGIADYYLCRAIVIMLMYCNYAINFYVYVLAGPRFRQELSKLFSCTKTTNKGTQASTTQELSRF